MHLYSIFNFKMCPINIYCFIDANITGIKIPLYVTMVVSPPLPSCGHEVEKGLIQWLSQKVEVIMGGAVIKVPLLFSID